MPTPSPAPGASTGLAVACGLGCLAVGAAGGALIASNLLAGPSGADSSTRQKGPKVSCCASAGNEEDVKKAIMECYGSVAKSGKGLYDQLVHGGGEDNKKTVKSQPTSSCCGESNTDPVALSVALGYTKEDLESVPKAANMGLGCGNTRTIADYKSGEVVVDLGCGGGLDAFIAAPYVGPGGRVIGVDMTHDMLSLARRNRKTDLKKYGHCEFRLGEIEHLPIADNTADVIISNCVINLSTEKQSVFNESFRVLKPGGRLAISDMVLFKDMPQKLKKDLRLICGCMGACALVGDLKNMMAKAGFEDIKMTEKVGFSEIVKGWAPGTGIEKYCTSMWITARKPDDANNPKLISLDTATPDFDLAPQNCGPGG